jgi:UDP-glucose 4-epimerase
VVVFDDFSSGRRANLARWIDDPRVVIVVATIAEGLFAPLSEFMRRRGPIERIIHLAAQVSVNRSLQNPLDDVRTNYTGTVQVLEYARCCGVKKVVFASSAAVYGDGVNQPAVETAECRPLSPYGVDKFGAEYFMRYYATVQGIPATALRFFNVYGPRQDPASPYSGVISIFAERALNRAPLTIFGDGRQTRDFVYVGDVCRAVVQACLDDATGYRVANIGTGSEITINELARLIVRLCESDSGIVHQAARSGDIVRSVAMIEQAQQLLGFRATMSLEDGLRRTLEWLRGTVRDEE